MWSAGIFIVFSVLAEGSWSFTSPKQDEMFSSSKTREVPSQDLSEYADIISNVLIGSKLINPDGQLCVSSLSKDLDSLTFDSLMSDILSFTQTCNYHSAYSTLSKFLKSPFLPAAASDIEPILPALTTNPNKKQSAFLMGQLLEYRIASMSPYVMKFKQPKAENKEKSDAKAASKGEFISEAKQEPSENDLKLLADSPYPIAIFHGLGDCCCFPGMMEFTRYLGKQVGSYTKCVEIGDGPSSSWIMGFQKQVNSACYNVQKIPQFAGGVNVVGLSQGGLIARALSEMCNVTVHNVITLGGPHMGVMAIPNCETGFYCDIFNNMLDLGVYDTFVQENAGPAGYFKDPLLYSEYLAKSEFLAAANNERSVNVDYANGFKAINQLVLIEFTEDTVVDPKISEQFGYFKIGSKRVLENFNETDDYINDVLGLKTLYQQGKVVFESIVGNHLQFNDTDIQDLVIPYLT